jgi:hypothetical protein
VVIAMIGLSALGGRAPKAQRDRRCRRGRLALGAARGVAVVAVLMRWVCCRR